MINKEFLKKSFPDINIFLYDTIDSTNSEAKRQITSGNLKTSIYIAYHQSAGRGRFGRSFYSPYKKGLYLSLAFPLKDSLEDVVSITSKASVAVSEAIYELSGIRCLIKWVNDLYLNDKKVCGILTELVSGKEPFVILGIGINLTTDFFPEDLKDKAAAINSKKLSMDSLTVLLSKKLLYYIENPQDNTYLSYYRDYSMVIGKNITYLKNSNYHKGYVSSINDKGYLVVTLENGEEDILNSGEVSINIL